MSRAAYCREQARFCRDAAAQMSIKADAAWLREMATSYETEADALDGVRLQPQHQPKGSGFLRGKV